MNRSELVLEIERLEREIKRLKAALEPFAAFYDEMAPDDYEDLHFGSDYYMTGKLFREAYEALHDLRTFWFMYYFGGSEGHQTMKVRTNTLDGACDVMVAWIKSQMIGSIHLDYEVVVGDDTIPLDEVEHEIVEFLA